MPRTPPSPFTYDPRPVDSVRLHIYYDWPSGRHTMVVKVKRHGEVSGTPHTFTGLDLDDAADLVAVMFSSLGRDGSTL